LLSHALSSFRTIERLAADMMTKPLAINETSRVSTIEALELDDLETDPAIAQNGDTASIPKPSALGANNRVRYAEKVTLN